ncbi:MAG: hypothetical protein ACOYOU_16475 [Kiritimatiellia bacterium]
MSRMEVPELLRFRCSDPIALPVDAWEARILSCQPLLDAHVLHIDGGSSFLAFVGSTESGHFLCLPDWDVAASLSDYDDTFYNLERLVPLLGPVDATTVACALRAAHKAGLI